MKERNCSAFTTRTTSPSVDLPLKHNRHFEGFQFVQIPFGILLITVRYIRSINYNHDTRGSLAGVRRPGSLRHTKQRSPALIAGDVDPTLSTKETSTSEAASNSIEQCVIVVILEQTRSFHLVTKQLFEKSAALQSLDQTSHNERFRSSQQVIIVGALTAAVTKSVIVETGQEDTWTLEIVRIAVIVGSDTCFGNVDFAFHVANW
jgi:hypothetical protein